MFLKLELRSLTDRKIPVPWATGFQELDDQADNYLYRISLPEDLPLAELVFTPFQNSLWPDLWYVKLVTREKTGVIARLARFMRDRKINIIGMDTNTTLQGKYHVSRVALDCRRYGAEQDGNYDERQSRPEATLNRLKNELILEFIDEIRFFEPSYPCISIERNQSLWRLYKETTEYGTDLSQERLGIKDGCFEIPSKDIHRLKGLYPKQLTQRETEPQALVTFDSESDLLRIGIFFKNFGIVPFTVSVKNRPGAIAAVAESLSKEDFNVLASKAQSIEEERIFVWMLLQNLSSDRTPMPIPIEDELIAGRVRRIILSSAAVREFRPLIVGEPIFQEV